MVKNLNNKTFKLNSGINIMVNQVYDRTVKPFTDLASAFYYGVYGRNATFPRQNTGIGRNTVSTLYHTPCETTRKHSVETLEQIRNTSKSPIVRGIASCFLNNPFN
jgi:hypothetical protein